MKEFKINTTANNWGNLAKSILGASIVSYQISDKQGLESCWDLYLNLNENNCLGVSSEINTVDGWNEFGVLTVNLEEQKKGIDGFITETLEQPFKITSIRTLEYEDDDFTTECGIEIVDEKGGTIKITSSPAPGAVSVDADFNHGHYRPEFLDKHCKVTNVYSV